jgi:hypothetical protein
MKTLLLNQPGRTGDILICLPIAKWYSTDYQIDWLCPEEYHSIFRHISYCQPIIWITKEYDKIINLDFGINQGTDLHKWWIDTRSQWQSFIIPKYKIAEVPLPERWNLVWNRSKEDYGKEISLYQMIVNKYGKDYSVVHQATHDFRMNLNIPNKVLFEPINGFSIFDWLLVLEKAKEIHCIDSSLCNFVEVLPFLMEKPKYYYITSKVPNIWDRTLLINNWRIINES